VIGGGYPDDDGLSNITLKWMLENAIDHELDFKNEPIRENPLGIRHDEYNKAKWCLLGKKTQKHS
jgi:hypothetical protein